MCRFCEQAAFGYDAPYDPQLGRGGVMPGSNMAPDLVLHGGTILTMDPLHPVAGAIAIREGIIQAVGDADRILAGCSRMTRVTDLGEAAIIPGLIAADHSLPEVRDRLSLDLWISQMVRAGVTTLHLANLEMSRAEYDTFHDLLMRRHRLRLRGAVGPMLKADWGEEPLESGCGHDLIRLDALCEPLSQGVEKALAMAQHHHEAGWSVILLDDTEPGDGVLAALAMAANGRSLSGIRIVGRRVDVTTARMLNDAGLEVVELVSAAPNEVPVTRGTVEVRSLQAARQAGVADICGMLRPGRYADFTFLDRAPSGETTGTPKVLGTWIEGVPVRQETDHVTI